MKRFVKETFLLFAMSIAFSVFSDSLQAEEPPLFFANSGQAVHIPTASQLRFLNTPIASNPSGMFKLPQLRAPGVVKAFDNSGAKIAEFVLYPDRATDSEEQVAAKLQGVPAWFEQWAKATRLLADETETPKLLILSSDTAGKSPQATLDVMEQHDQKTSLVFSPNWSGPARSKSIALSLAHAKGKLLRNYDSLGNPAPLIFSHLQTPCNAVINRTAWLGPSVGLPYVEELLFDHNRRVIVSYIPWQELLGQHEQADHLFRHLLVNAAKNHASSKASDDPSVTLQLKWPRRWDVRKDERPIIHHILSRQARTSEKQAPQSPTLHVVDLRGKSVQQAKYPQLRKALTARPLLILGNDPAIDDKQLKSPDVIWFKNDSLPSEFSDTYRLMETLAKWRVPL